MHPGIVSLPCFVCTGICRCPLRHTNKHKYIYYRFKSELSAIFFVAISKGSFLQSSLLLCIYTIYKNGWWCWSTGSHHSFLVDVETCDYWLSFKNFKLNLRKIKFKNTNVLQHHCHSFIKGFPSLVIDMPDTFICQQHTSLCSGAATEAYSTKIM